MFQLHCFHWLPKNNSLVPPFYQDIPTIPLKALSFSKFKIAKVHAVDTAARWLFWPRKELELCRGGPVPGDELQFQVRSECDGSGLSSSHPGGWGGRIASRSRLALSAERGGMHRTLIPGLRDRGLWVSEFETSLVYTASKFPVSQGHTLKLYFKAKTKPEKNDNNNNNNKTQNNNKTKQKN